MKCPLCLLFLFQSHPAQASLLSLLMSTLAGGRVAYQCCFAFEPAKMPSASRGEEADAAGSLPPTTDEPSQAVAGSDSLDSPPRALERSVGQLPSPPLLPTPTAQGRLPNHEKRHRWVRRYTSFHSSAHALGLGGCHGGRALTLCFWGLGSGQVWGAERRQENNS